MPGDGPPAGEEIEWANAYLKAKYGDILKRLATGQQPVGWEEQQVAAMFKGQSASAYALAAENLRVQEGLCEPFHDSLLRSRYYRPRMEQVFAGAGLPPELVALALVESGFSARVRSSASALGIWQFTRSTGREFLKITRPRRSARPGAFDAGGCGAFAIELPGARKLAARDHRLQLWDGRDGASGF
jgi:Transglycosylase SLT domain